MRIWALLALVSGSFTLLADPPRPRDGNFKVGDAAPKFELKQLGAEKPVKLADLKGKPVVLIFGSCEVLTLSRTVQPTNFGVVSWANWAGVR